MNDRYLIGVFEDEDPLFEVVEELKTRNIPIHDVYTPFPVHGLDNKLGIKRSNLPYVTFATAMLGLVLSLYFQYWTSVDAWPVNVGGKAFNSLPAFIPVTFEVTVLFGGLLTVAVFFFIGRLYPGKEAFILDRRVTDDRFVVAIRAIDASFDIEEMKNFFFAYKATDVRIVNTQVDL